MEQGQQEGEQASWNLVHFIRRLPKLTPEEIKEMESLNPKSPAEVREDIEAEILKNGGKPAAKPAVPHRHTHGRGTSLSPAERTVVDDGAGNGDEDASDW